MGRAPFQHAGRSLDDPAILAPDGPVAKLQWPLLAPDGPASHAGWSGSISMCVSPLGTERSRSRSRSSSE